MKEEIVKQVMEQGGIEVAVEYTKKFIEAATPVTKQAYEIGLMTLQIDAAQSVITGVALLVLALILGLKFLPKCYCGFDDDPYGVYAPLAVFGTIFTVIGFVIAMVILSDIWVWIKLFRPELWLAHEAIEKLMK